MNFFPLAELSANARSAFAMVIVTLAGLYALTSFVCVWRYASGQVATRTLVSSESAPPSFRMGALPGWLFVATVLELIFTGSPLFYLLVVLGIGVLLVQEGRTADEQFGLRRLSARRLLQWSVLVCGAVAFVEFPLESAVEWIMTLCQVPHPPQDSVQAFRHLDTLEDLASFLLFAIIISPMLEELFFRGFLLTFLRRYTGTWLAIILSAGVFAFAHVNLGSVFQLWLLGIVLGVAYQNTGSLLMPMGIHACFNLVTAVGLLVEKGLG